MENGTKHAKTLIQKLVLTFGCLLFFGGGVAFSQTYVALHYTSTGLLFGASPTVDSFNPCIYDNGTSSGCESSSILTDPDNASSATTTADQSTHRYFEKSLQPAIGTVRFAVGYNKVALWDYVGFRVGGVFGLLSIRGKNRKTYMEGFGPLGGYEFELYGNKDPLKLMGLYPFFRYTQYRSNLIPIYFLGENKSGQRYVRKSGDIDSVVYEYGASIKINLGNPKLSRGPSSGFFFDVMRSDTRAKLSIGENSHALKTVVGGFSIKFSIAL